MMNTFQVENEYLEALQAFPDVSACAANRALISEFLKEEGLAVTAANIATAITTLGSQLAFIEKRRAPEPEVEVVPETEQQLLRRLQKEYNSPDPAVANRAKAMLKELSNKNCAGRLPKIPVDITATDIKQATPRQLENLYTRYGSEAVRNRLFGRS